MDMTMTSKKRRIIKIALAVALGAWLVKAFLLPLLFPPYHPDRTPKMDKIPPRIAALFGKTRPVCFGRFMIDVPETARVVWGPAGVPYEFITYPGEGPKIKAEIAAKIARITSEKHNEEPSMLIGVFDSVNPESKVVVGYESTIDAFFAQLHSYIRLGQTVFVQSIPSSGLFVSDTSVPSGRRHDKTAYKYDVEELQDIARRLRLRADDEAPEEAGVCLESAFLPSSLDYQIEHIRIGFRFPEYPDVSVSIWTHSTDHPSKEDTLEASLESGREYARIMGMSLAYARISVLRKGERVMGPWQGEEALARLPHHDGQPSVHEFQFATPGEANDMLRPFVDLKLHTGVQENEPAAVKPSLTDDEAVALWDKLTTTIRVRPTKDAQPASGQEETKP
jgi:hypothetical protein